MNQIHSPGKCKFRSGDVKIAPIAGVAVVHCYCAWPLSALGFKLSTTTLAAWLLDAFFMPAPPDFWEAVAGLGAFVVVWAADTVTDNVIASTLFFV